MLSFGWVGWVVFTTILSPFYSLATGLNFGVHRSLRFPEILKKAGLSNLRDETLDIILEIDTKPPAGAITQTSLIATPLSITLQHHDLTTLMAGKIAALCLRPFVKSRDWYDWLWYRSNPTGTVVTPNLRYLQEAVNQDSIKKQETPWNASEWGHHIRTKLESNNFPNDLQCDIARFLERPEDAIMMTKENFLAAMDGFVK